jgi:hypothetical protein
MPVPRLRRQHLPKFAQTAAEALTSVRHSRDHRHAMISAGRWRSKPPLPGIPAGDQRLSASLIFVPYCLTLPLAWSRRPLARSRRVPGEAADGSHGRAFDRFGPVRDPLADTHGWLPFGSCSAGAGAPAGSSEAGLPVTDSGGSTTAGRPANWCPNRRSPLQRLSSASR